MVVGFDRTAERSELDLDRWVDLAAETLAGEGIDHGRLDLIFVGPDEMAELNQTHMGHDGPTDVLSFPLDAPDLTAGADGGSGSGVDPGAPDSAGPEVSMPDLDLLELVGELDDDQDPMTLHLGDVIVCPEVATRQAPEHCGDREAEMSLLVIHGVLHILGHDHAEAVETEVMQARERHHLERLGYRHPEFR